MKKAWEIERELRDAAIPVDRRTNQSHWYAADSKFPTGDDLIRKFWHSNVPGSYAPEIPYQEMVQAWSNQGYDVSQAEALLPDALALREGADMDALRLITAEILNALVLAPLSGEHPYHLFSHPTHWEAVLQAMPASALPHPKAGGWQDSYNEKTYQGWLGQLAGGSFGTAIEGYTGARIKQVYGTIDGYITEPETTNDDVVYELVLLDAVEKHGKNLSSANIAAEWLCQIPFGWSAEWVALRNLNMGIFPPESGSFLNFYSDWIGVQMRGMICGMLYPNQPLDAARLAFTDGVVSHAKNGVYGGIMAAVLPALAYENSDPRQLVKETLNYLPAKSEYAYQYQYVLGVLENETSPQAAWETIEPHFKRCNWIHAYPNMAADLFALWYGAGDFTESMKLLAMAGYDVDCNAGLVGNVLGIIQPVPKKWAEPIGDLLETYLRGKERLSIRALAQQTCRLANV